MKTFRELEIGDSLWCFSLDGFMRGGKIRNIYSNQINVEYKEFHVDGFNYSLNVSKDLDKSIIERGDPKGIIKIYGTDLESLKKYGEKRMIEKYEQDISEILEILGKKLDRIDIHYENLKRAYCRG